jgi:hypothetical protein
VRIHVFGFLLCKFVSKLRLLLTKRDRVQRYYNISVHLISIIMKDVDGFLTEARRCCCIIICCEYSCIAMFQIKLPSGAIDCWVFLCCMELLALSKKLASESDSGGNQLLETYTVEIGRLWEYASNKVNILTYTTIKRPAC